MKLITIIMGVLVIGFVLITVGLFVSDLEGNYPDANINDSTWAGKYDYQEDLNDSVSSIKRDFETMADAESWWTIMGAGFVAFAKAIFLIPTTLFLGLGKGVLIITGMGEFFAVDAQIVAYAITSLLIIIVFSFITWWRRFKE